MGNNNMLPAIPIGTFKILDNGYADILVVCPVCRHAFFIEDELDSCVKPGDRNVYGEQKDMSPMELVCGECEAWAEAFLPKFFLRALLIEGHLEIHEEIVRALNDSRFYTPINLVSPEEVWALIYTAAAERDLDGFQPNVVLVAIFDAFRVAEVTRNLQPEVCHE